VAGEERLRHAALFNLGALRFVAGDLDGASAALEELLPRMEARGDGHGQGRVLHALAAIHLARDEPSAALALLDRACAIKERMGDVNGAANSQNSRAMALMRLGRLPEGRAAVERALAVPAADAEAWARCYFLTTRAAIDLLSGAVDVALDGYREALRQPGIAGTDAQARASVQFALALLVAGDTDAAERLLQETGGASGARPSGWSADRCGRARPGAWRARRGQGGGRARWSVTRCRPTRPTARPRPPC
jgi:tetratricopeptide (TPR) repeat protein